jgi:hypothetical protein
MQPPDSAAASVVGPEAGYDPAEWADVHAVRTHMDATNAFGVPLRTRYKCVVGQRAIGGEWDVIYYVTE